MITLLLAVAVLAGSGLLALAATRSYRMSTLLGAGGAVVGSLIGLIPAVATLAGEGPAPFLQTWLHGLGGSFHIALDALSSFFVILILVLTALAAVYGSGYLASFAERRSVGVIWFFFNLLTASMVLVVVARNGVLFLVAWEAMALASFFLVVVEDEKASVRQAGWVYAVATHAGMGFLVALFVLACEPGSLEFGVAGAGAGTCSLAHKNLLFCLAVVGFGLKAGLVPLHVWLPEAHPAAPSHVSAVLSAVMVKIGLYGILRTLTFLGAPEPWWGPFLVVIGLAGGVLGIALAMYQRDLKRALAYSTVENVGLIVVALGTALWGKAQDMPIVTALGLTAAFLHLLNHALMKGLLFLAAGSILHGTGTKDMERLGGLLKRMPWTGSVMIIGALAIAGLPPLNGFVGEWLMYLGLLNAGLSLGSSGAVGAFLSVGALAFVGGVAAIGFVRLAGIVLLGEPRSAAAGHAHEGSVSMVFSMAFLALLCIAVALVPGLVAQAIAPPIDQVSDAAAGDTLYVLRHQGMVSLNTLGVMNLLLWVLVGLGVLGLRRLWLRNGSAEAGTWGCGYVASTPRIQYTSRSFTETMAEHLLPRPLRPHVEANPPLGLFPKPATFASDCPDPVRDGIYQPLFRGWAERFVRLRWLQQGKLPIYLLYLFLLVVAGLAWVSLRSWWGGPS